MRIDRLKTRKWIQQLIKVVISGSLILFLFSQVEISKIKVTLIRANLLYIVVGFILYLCANVLAIYKWQLILVSQDIRLSLWRVGYLYYVGLFFSNFLPSGFGGDIVRVYELSKYTGEKTDPFVSVVSDRFISLYSLLIVALAFSFWVGEDLILVNSKILLLAFFLITLTVLFACHRKSQSVIISVVNHLGHRALSNLIGRIFDSLEVLKYNINAILLSLLVSVIFQMIAVVLNYILLLSLGARPPFLRFSLLMPIIILISMLPISINGIGVREGAYVLLLGEIGVPLSIALTVSLLNVLIFTACSLIGGVMYATRISV